MIRRTTFLLAFAACAAGTRPAPSLSVRALLVGDSLRIVTQYQLPGPDRAGAIDSARLTITGTPDALVKRLPILPLTGTDTTRRQGPPPGQGYGGAVCVTVFRRAEKTQACAPWSLTRGDIPPTAPTLTVAVDTVTR